MTDAEKYLEIVPSIVGKPFGLSWILDICVPISDGFVLELPDGPMKPPPEIALAILQRHVREWLEAWAAKRRAFMSYDNGAKGWDITAISLRDDVPCWLLLEAPTPNIHDALIAAVKAASEEDHA